MKIASRLMSSIAIAGTLVTYGCMTPDDGAEEGSSERTSVAEATTSRNGLPTINGLNSTNGLMTTAAGRLTVSYLVKCALPAGRSITKKDQYGTSYTYAGQLGFAPEYEASACNTTCQRYVSACMMAHVNTAGVHIPLWLDAAPVSVGWGRSPSYPRQEGSFFGNIFVSPPQAYYCNGKDFATNVVPGRLGAGQVGAPYANPFGATATCADRCVPLAAPRTGDGYKSCLGFTEVVTVWRP